MAGKARVHELAKELNVSSKDVLAKLSELGEFVKSASSTVEPPVARRLREAFPPVPPPPTNPGSVNDRLPLMLVPSNMFRMPTTHWLI